MNNVERTAMGVLNLAMDGFDVDADIIIPRVSECSSLECYITNVTVSVTGNLIIYAIEMRRVGMFIGKRGSNIVKVKEYLQNNFPDHMIQINLIEKNIWNWN